MKRLAAAAVSAAALVLLCFCFACERSAFAEEAAQPVPAVTPSPEAVSDPAPVPTPFSFLWESDTQKLAGHGEEYSVAAEWVLGELEPRNAVCFLHTGDIVGVYKNAMQWERAQKMLVPLKERLPYLIIAGNHDFDDKRFNYEPFRKGVYTEEELAALENDPTSYNRGQGRYLLETFGGIDFLFVGIAQNPDEEALAWVGSVLERYPERIAVLLMHGYMQPDGRVIKSAVKLFDRLIAPYPNVRLVLCGHYAGIATRRDDFEDGRFVQTIVCNLQDSRSRRGTVQFLTVDPEASTLSLYAWSPVRFEKEPVEFTLELDLR